MWILDNQFYDCDTVLLSYADKNKVRREIDDFPSFLDEAKAVYITEAPNAFWSYFPFVDLVKKVDAVTCFVYSHWTSRRRMEKGVRRTYFQGYNVPSTFEMPDYSLMPPAEDFRRTLYWNPDVRTDGKGEAIIEFYNNSSCREIRVSVEGVTPDGRCIFNE